MEFVCRDPNAEVRAASAGAILDAFKQIPGFGEKLVARHRFDLGGMTPESFVPMQWWLDALKEVQTRVGTAMMREVGTRIVQNAHFPPTYGGADAILLALDDIYHLNHRGEVGHYVSSRAPDGVVIVRCETPYPRHFEWGLIEGICRNKAVGGRKFAVDFEPGPADGDRTCTVTVHWPDPVSGQWRKAPAP